MLLYVQLLKHMFQRVNMCSHDAQVIPTVFQLKVIEGQAGDKVEVSDKHGFFLTQF